MTGNPLVELQRHGQSKENTQQLLEAYKIAGALAEAEPIFSAGDVTGQLHKGGGDHALFLQFTAEDPSDLAIPGEVYSFGIMKRAQALGDLRALQRRGRRVLRIHFTGNAEGGLGKIQRALRSVG